MTPGNNYLNTLEAPNSIVLKGQDVQVENQRTVCTEIRNKDLRWMAN
jgi:hypothetical protein